jgi:hypothetical protein
LRDAFQKTLKDTGFLDEVKSKKLDAEYTSGEEMHATGQRHDVAVPEIIERLRKVLGN